jgi:hypothetical protein
MEIKSYVDIEIIKKATVEGKEIERAYHFLMPVGSPFGEAYDVAFQALSRITELAQQAAEATRPKEATEPEVIEAVPTKR